MLLAARNREATARFGWSPYMHNPKLKGRLHRIRIPTLFLWGTADRILSEHYGRAYCAAIAGAKFEPIERAGHFPHIEQPEEFARRALGVRRRQAGEGERAALRGDRAMQVYQFTEQPYYPAWNDHNGSLRVNLPNSKLDPKIAADLFHRYYDEWALCDELGLDIMLNEHHQTATCMSSTVIVALSVLARITKSARLLVLGYPIGHRPDPLRVRGRTLHHRRDLARPPRHGLHQGRALRISGLEPEPGRRDGPLLGGARFHPQGDDEPRRAVQLGGRIFPLPASQHLAAPDQQPHPPLWSTTGIAQQCARARREGYVMATLGSGYDTRPLFDAYREGYLAKGAAGAGADRFAYLGLVAVAHDEDEARRRGELVADICAQSAIVHLPFRNPPGFLSVEDNARMLRGKTPPRSSPRTAARVNMHHGSVQDLIDAGILFCGTPDQVYRQIVDFCDYCGGMGNLLMMGHAGFLTHEDTVDNLTLFAKEVLPRLKEYKQPGAEATAA